MTIADIERKPLRQAAVRLPPERVEQLKILKKKLNMASTADTIGFLIRKEFDALGLHPVIPGVRVIREGQNVLLAFERAEILLSPEDAAFAVHEIRIRTIPKGTTTRNALTAAVDLLSPEFDGGLRPLAITKKGTGVNVRISRQMKSFSPALANELADLIEATVA